MRPFYEEKVLDSRHLSGTSQTLWKSIELGAIFSKLILINSLQMEEKSSDKVNLELNTLSFEVILYFRADYQTWTN